MKLFPKAIALAWKNWSWTSMCFSTNVLRNNVFFTFGLETLLKYVFMNPVYLKAAWICIVISPSITSIINTFLSTHVLLPTPLWCMSKLFTYLTLLLGVPTCFWLVYWHLNGVVNVSVVFHFHKYKNSTFM